VEIVNALFFPSKIFNEIDRGGKNDSIWGRGMRSRGEVRRPYYIHVHEAIKTDRNREGPGGSEGRITHEAIKADSPSLTEN